MSIKPKLRFWESVLEEQNEQSKICPKCETKVYKSELRLRGRNWHQECFQCLSCAKTLNLTTFREVNNQFFCSECYTECFIKRWRCSEVIDERRLSKQMKSVVMDGHKYRWQHSTAFNNDIDSIDSENTSFCSAQSDSPQFPSDRCRETEASRDSSYMVDDPDCHSPENLPRGRIRAYTAGESPVSTRFDVPRIPNADRSMRQISRGRRFASEGIPERSFEPGAAIFEKAEQEPDDEVTVPPVRLRATSLHNRVPRRSDNEDASCRIIQDHSCSRIPLILETSEDSDATDSGESRTESNTSEEQRAPPPKPQRRRESTAVCVERTVDQPVVRGEVTKQSQTPKSRRANAHFIRHTRFPSDHVSHLPMPPHQ